MNSHDDKSFACGQIPVNPRAKRVVGGIGYGLGRIVGEQCTVLEHELPELIPSVEDERVAPLRCPRHRPHWPYQLGVGSGHFRVSPYVKSLRCPHRSRRKKAHPNREERNLHPGIERFGRQVAHSCFAPSLEARRCGRDGA